MSKFYSGEPPPGLVMVRNDTGEPEQIVSHADIKERSAGLNPAEVAAELDKIRRRREQEASDD